MKFIQFALVGLAIASLFSSCFLFRKKNRCGDCPHWHRAKAVGEAPASKYR